MKTNNKGAAQAAAEAALDNFDDRFLGAKSSDPSVDNDGNALTDGALYSDIALNARHLVEEQYNWHKISDSLIQIFGLLFLKLKWILDLS